MFDNLFTISENVGHHWAKCNFRPIFASEKNRMNVLDLGGAKELNARVSAEVTAKKVRIDNIIVSEDWAGVHAWMSVHRPDGSADAFDTMAFYHFVEGGDGTLKVDKCWIKENIL